MTLARELRAVFDDVHHHGERALMARDFKTFGEAIAVERSLIQEQREAIRATIKNIQKRRAAIDTVDGTARNRRRTKRRREQD